MVHSKADAVGTKHQASPLWKSLARGLGVPGSTTRADSEDEKGRAGLKGNAGDHDRSQ